MNASTKIGSIFTQDSKEENLFKILLKVVFKVATKAAPLRSVMLRN